MNAFILFRETVVLNQQIIILENAMEKDVLSHIAVSRMS